MRTPALTTTPTASHERSPLCAAARVELTIEDVYVLAKPLSSADVAQQTPGSTDEEKEAALNKKMEK